MADDEAAERLAGIVQGLLADAVHQADGSIVTKYVAAVEVIDPSGECALWGLASPGLKAWETVGMLEYLRDIERAAPEP